MPLSLVAGETKDYFSITNAICTAHGQNQNKPKLIYYQLRLITPTSSSIRPKKEALVCLGSLKQKHFMELAKDKMVTLASLRVT